MIEKNSEERQIFSNKDMFELPDISIVVINNKGDIVFTNESWKKFIIKKLNDKANIITGGNYIKSIGKYITDGFKLRSYENLISEAIEKKIEVNDIKLLLNTLSEPRWINIQLLPLHDKTDYTLIIHQDITDLINIQSQKAENELIFNVLIENLNDIIFTIAKDLRYNSVYGKWVDKTGKKDSDFIGHTASFVMGEDGVVHEEAAKKAFTGVNVTYQWEIISPVGKKLHFQTSLFPIIDSEGNISNLVGLGRDITDLTEERIKAQISDKLKSTFLSSISHEIRTPLNAILGFSQLMLEHPGLNENLREYANIIIRRGNDLVKIVDDIMEMSMIHAGAVQPEFDDVSVNALLNSIYEDYSSKYFGKATNIEFKNEKRIYGKKFFIHSDGNILRQIFNKIIENSIKFTTQGQINFGYTLKENDEIIFYVSDTGIGILPEKQKLIFDLFRTGDESISRAHEGLGLGLAIVKELVAVLGGDIWFSSLPGKGTDMYFSIPIEKIGTTKNQASGTFINRNLFPGKKILIVEDDTLNLYYMSEILEAAQVEILTAADGNMAINILESTHDIDLVFLDLNLPFHSGEEILKRLRKSGNNVKVVIQSAFRKDAYNIPSDFYSTFLSKPLKPSEIHSVLQKYL